LLSLTWDKRITMKKVSIILLLFVFLVPLGAGNKSPRRFELINSEKGLSTSFIITIFRDKQGFMWLGTVNGLIKYDGYRWTTYREQLQNKENLQSHIIVSINEDQEGILWLGARNALIRFDTSREEFRHFPIRLPDSPMAAYTQVGRICKDPLDNDILWLQVMDKLARFQKSTGNVTYLGVPEDPSNLKSLNSFYQFHTDPKGNLWFASQAGILKYNPVQDAFVDFRKKGSAPPSPAAAYSISPSNLEPGVLWFGNIGAIERIDTDTGKSTIFHPPFEGRKPAISIITESITNPNTLLLATWGDGLYEYNLKTGFLHSSRHIAGDPQSIAGDAIMSMFQDEGGTLWIGTGTGLNRFEERKNRIEIVNARHGDKAGLNSAWIYYIDESKFKPNQLWIGTSDGLNLYDRNKNDFQAFRFGYGGPIGPNHITHGVESDYLTDVMWLASLGGGLYKLNTQTMKHDTFMHDSKDDSSIGSLFIMRIYESKTKHHGLWLGTMDNGIDFFDYTSHRFRHYRHSKDIDNSIASGPVVAFHESVSRPGFLWVATAGGGLNKLDLETETFVRFQYDYNDPGSLTGNMLNCFYESPKEPGILWIGTAVGLNRFDMKKEVFSDFPGKAELKNYNINGLVEDKAGNFWITTFSGILRYTPADGSILHLDARDGFLSNENGGICISKKGEVFLTALKGLNVFRPEEIRRNTFVPPVVITELRVANRPVKVGERINGAMPILEESVSRTRQITLSYKDRVFSFHYAALNYYNSEKNQYAYMMEGFDDDWINVGDRRMAVFTGLPHGKYTFRVKGSNNDGVWNESGASIKVIITPPWWKTRWATVIYILTVLLLIILVNRLQRQRLLRREREQSRLREADLRARAAEAQAQAMEAENRRKTHELEEARRLQLSMLPRKVPSLPGIEIGVFMQTATEVGGDYYDIQISPGGELTIACGDATGHGLNAGTMVSIMKGILTSRRAETDLSEFFATSSTAMKRMRLGNLFMGLVLLQQRKDGWWSISAGMPPIIVYRAKTGEAVTYSQKTPPLGAFAAYTYTAHPIRFEKGDTVLLFSDGLPELFNGREEMFGYDNVTKHFKEAAAAGLSPEGIIASLREAGESWRQNCPQDDDITFVVLRFTG
jgi:serine phosphatase RsbU (regulator of sigma subunit)/ligand-binding sensor domain-containing protein